MFTMLQSAIFFTEVAFTVYLEILASQGSLNWGGQGTKYALGCSVQQDIAKYAGQSRLSSAAIILGVHILRKRMRKKH